MRIENFLWEWNYIMLNKPLMRKIGIAEAAFLCELISARMRFKQDEFYFTQKEIEEETWITESTQMRYTKKLQGLWLITVEKKGIPARNFYKIYDNKIFEIITWETSAVNLTEQATPDWSDYSNNKETKKESNKSSEEFKDRLKQEWFSEELIQVILDFDKKKKKWKMSQMEERYLKQRIKTLRECWDNKDELMIKVVENSIINWWTKLVPLKPREKSTSDKPNTLVYH